MTFLIRSLLSLALLSSLTLGGCSDDDSSPAAEAAPDTTVEGCPGLQKLPEGPRPGVRYTGPNGFAFELLDGAGDKQAAVASCLSLEGHLDSLVAAGIAGAILDYRTPVFHFAGARGEAETTEHRAMSAGALFRVASEAKPYVGALAALLANEGKLDLDNSDGKHSLGDYLPEVRGKIDQADQITVRQLLNHTSGVPDYFSDALGEKWMAHVLERYHQGGGVTEDEALALVYGQKNLFAPGTSGAYSNTGYVLASRVMTAVLGRPYQEELRARLLDPLELRDTFWEKHEAFDAARLSHGYRDASPLGESFSDWFAVDQGYGFANGGVVATASDLARFFRAIPGGKGTLPGVDVGKLAQAMRAPGGYGLGVVETDGCYWHGGEFTGYSSMAFSCPEVDRTGVVLINSSLPEHEALAEEISQKLR